MDWQERIVTGAKMAWGATDHAVKYIVHRLPNLPTHSHTLVRQAVRQLDNQHRELYLASDIGQAEALHEQLYRGPLRHHQVRNSWQVYPTPDRKPAVYSHPTIA